MGFDPHEPEQRRLLCAALHAADLNAADLWLGYFSIGGAAGEYEVEAYLHGLLSLPVLQRDLLAMAANELIDDLPRMHAPCSGDFSDGPPHSHAHRAWGTRQGRPAGEERRGRQDKG